MKVLTGRGRGQSDKLFTVGLVGGKKYTQGALVLPFTVSH